VVSYASVEFKTKNYANVDYVDTFFSTIVPTGWSEFKTGRSETRARKRITGRHCLCTHVRRNTFNERYPHTPPNGRRSITPAYRIYRSSISLGEKGVFEIFPNEKRVSPCTPPPNHSIIVILSVLLYFNTAGNVHFETTRTTFWKSIVSGRDRTFRRWRDRRAHNRRDR